MRYIVTGGAGFIGSNLADTLAQHHDVVTIDNLATGRRVNIEPLHDHPRVTFVGGSITDLDLLMADNLSQLPPLLLSLGAPQWYNQGSCPNTPGSSARHGERGCDMRKRA
ncbi:MAG: NAD-dependent epimerase/dehydratase family protein [Clostridiaceae bacterium]|nr:NAD-dependent epimerase/dehydratase family protein [Clostridiaceae bacterium]